MSTVDDHEITTATPADEEVESTRTGSLEADTQPEAVATELAKGPRVFISHKRDVEVGDDIATRLARDLAPCCGHVYLDLNMALGEEYEHVVQNEIGNADVFIALISPAANGSDWIKTEAKFADYYYRERGKPRILPVRLGYEGLYDPFLDVYLGRFNALFWDPAAEDYHTGLLEPLQFAIANPGEPTSEKSLADYGLSGFVVHNSRQQRFKVAYLEPSALEQEAKLIHRNPVLWVVGEAGVRNYVALSLAVNKKPQKLYEISKPRSWSKINSSIVQGSIIVFQDFTPSLHFDESTPKSELDSLRALVKRGNTVIVTMTEDGFSEVEREMLKEEFEYGSARIRVNKNTYDDHSKLEIFRKLLEHSYRNDSIQPKQYQWACNLLDPSINARKGTAKLDSHDKFLEILGKCTPADIERFFTLLLGEVEKPSDFVRLLQRNIGGDEEIHSWFVSLDDATRCFVMTLALCSELTRDQLWEHYKTIVRSLRTLDPQLALLTFGIGRQRATPYVSLEGPLDFVNSRVGDVIRDEIAMNYREHLVELLPKMKDWTVAPSTGNNGDGADELRKRKANELQPLRESVARLIGKAARYGLDDLRALLEHWASDPIMKVRESVAIALEQTAQDSASANRALDLLRDWHSDFANNERAFFRLYATASALTRFASSRSSPAISRRAFEYLHRLTKDTRRSVRFYTSIALKKMAGKLDFEALVSSLGELARDENLSTRVNVAQALNEVRFGKEEKVSGLVSQWLSSAEPSLRWVAICSQLIRWQTPRRTTDETREAQFDETRRLLEVDNVVTASVLLELMADERLKKLANPIFERLVDLEDQRARLIEGLSHVDFNQLDKKLLGRLRAVGDLRQERLVIEVRLNYWKRLLVNPSQLLMDLRKRLGEGKHEIELFHTFVELLNSMELRESFIDALTMFYPQDHEILDEVLRKLRKMAPSVFEGFCAEVRSRALANLFHDPPALMQTVSDYLAQDEISPQIYLALGALAQAEPIGRRKELLQALAYGYAVNQPLVRSVLHSMRSNGPQALRSICYEFHYSKLQGYLREPAMFVNTVLAMMADPPEREELSSVLAELALPEPRGNRRLLVSALSQARAMNSAFVDQFFQSVAELRIPALFRLQMEVRVSTVSSVFIPKFVSRWFRATERSS